jgi:hypothetical protein
MPLATTGSPACAGPITPHRNHVVIDRSPGSLPARLVLDAAGQQHLEQGKRGEREWPNSWLVP